MHRRWPIFFFSVLFALFYAMQCFAQEKPSLYLYNWGNYISPAVIKRFEVFCKCTLVQDLYTDNEEMLAKLAAGAQGYDLIVPTGNAVEALIKQHALRPYDVLKIPNFKNLKPDFQHLWYDPKNTYSVPYAYTITLLGYNEEKMKELGIPTDTWAALFEPKYLEKLKGHVTVLDSQRELLGAALKYFGYSVNDTNIEHWKQARGLILRAKPYWAAFNAASYAKEISTGNIWLAQGYSAELYLAKMDLKKRNATFYLSISIPKEGAVLAVDNLVMHKTGNHPELAHLFVNFILDGKNGSELTNMIGSGNPNAAAMPYIKPEIANNSTLFPDQNQFAKLEMLKDFDRKQRRLLNRFWIAIKVY